MEIKSTKMDELKSKHNESYTAYFSGAKLVTKRRQQQRLSVVVTGSNAEQVDTCAQDVGRHGTYDGWWDGAHLLPRLQVLQYWRVQA